MAEHVAALFSKLGDNQGRLWLEGLKNNDCALCAGMADVKNRVASGELWFGITSTIDAHVAVDGGKPVAVVFPDQGPGEIGCLQGYGTVALVAGRAPHPKEVERLVRFPHDDQDRKNPCRRAGPERRDAAGERRRDVSSRVDSPHASHHGRRLGQGRGGTSGGDAGRSRRYCSVNETPSLDLRQEYLGVAAIVLAVAIVSRRWPGAFFGTGLNPRAITAAFRGITKLLAVSLGMALVGSLVSLITGVPFALLVERSRPGLRRVFWSLGLVVLMVPPTSRFKRANSPRQRR